MKLKDLIKRIQNKPRSTRILILWTATGVITIIIVLIWIFSFSRSINENSDKEDLEFPSLFESIKIDFSTIKEQINASVKDIKQQNLEIDTNEEEK